MTAEFRRGSVHWVGLDPVRGFELAKTRPCVVLSATDLNALRKTIVIVPLTTTPQPARWPLLIEVPSAGARSKARIEQIRAVDKSRVGNVLGSVHADHLTVIENALLDVLQIKR